MRKSCPKPTPSIITDSLCGSSTVDVTEEIPDRSCSYLTVLLEDESVYEWFELSDDVLGTITLEKLLDRVMKYFNIEQASLRDVDGHIKSTCDLRRSLRSAYPTIRISASSNRVRELHVSDETPVMRERLRPAQHARDQGPQTNRVTLRKRNLADKFGFSNVPSRDGKAVVVTDIDPDGLLRRMRTNMHVGDTIVSVNGVSGDAHAIRRELLVSTIIDMQFTSFTLDV